MTTLPASVQAKIFQSRTVGTLPPTEYQVSFANLGDLLEKQVEKYGEKIFLIFYSGDERKTFSYREFYGLVCKTAGILCDKGVTAGDRIATISHNHAETVVQYFAAWSIGAVVVPVNVGEDDKRIGYILKHANTKLAFVRE